MRGMLVFLIAVALACEVTSEIERLPRRVCYYTPSEAPAIEDIPGDLCTNVLYAFSRLSVDTWEIEPANYQFDIVEGGYKRFTALKEKYPELKTDLSINDDNIAYMARYKPRRDAFVRSVVDLLNTFGFDGLDIDWEFPLWPIERENYPVLVSELRAAFDAEGKGWNLTTAVPSSPILADVGFDIPELCSVFDAVHFMGYDLRSSEEGFTDVHSPLYRRPNLDFFIFYDYNINDGILKWVTEGCPRHKLILGVPFYGRSFTLIKAERHGLHALAEIEWGGWYDYGKMCKSFIDDPGWGWGYDDVGLVPYAFRDTFWVGYEDTDSLSIKMNYIREMGFGGAMNWQLNCDDYSGYCGQGKWPMLNALNDGLQNYTVPVNFSSEKGETNDD